ncbi:hypothetical protein LT493_24280 [Streptomyces tricolor]|nr:hypothetical protein [Streptomyces tricolor]
MPRGRTGTALRRSGPGWRTAGSPRAGPPGDRRCGLVRRVGRGRAGGGPAGGGTTRSRRTSGPTRRSIQVRVAASTMVMLGTARGAGVTTTTWFGR